MDEDAESIALRRRSFLARSLATLGAAATGTIATTCQPCLSYARPACPTPAGKAAVGRWVYVGGATPKLVSTLPILFVGDKDEGTTANPAAADAAGNPMPRLSHDNRPANETLTDDSKALLDEVAKLLKQYEAIVLHVDLTAEDPALGGDAGVNPVPSSVPTGRARATAIAAFLETRQVYVDTRGNGACEKGVFTQRVELDVCGPIPTAR